MINELKTFIAVCRHGTFAAAGNCIGLTQSAVSSQIKRLEENLGFDLFDRTARAAILNAAGEATLKRAEEICALYAKLGEAPDELTSSASLRVGAIASIQSTILARALQNFRQQFPFVRVHISPGVSMHLMDELDSEKIDAALIIRPPFGFLPELTWQALVNEPFVLVAPANLIGNDWRNLIQKQPFLRYDRVSFGGRIVERFLRREGLSVRESIEIDEISGLIHLAAKGLGVALVPMVEAYLPLPNEVCMISLGRSTFYREIGILRRKHKTSPAIVDQFAQCLVKSSKMTE